MQNKNILKKIIFCTIYFLFSTLLRTFFENFSFIKGLSLAKLNYADQYWYLNLAH